MGFWLQKVQRRVKLMIMAASENQEARETKVRRENAYYITALLVFAALTAATMALSQYFTGDRWSTLLDNLFFYIWCFGNLATKAGTMACRRLGVSLDGQKIEKIKRANGANTAIYVEEPLVMNRRSARFIVMFCLIFYFSLFGFALFISAHPKNNWQIIMLTFIFSTLLVMLCFSLSNIRKPEVCIDKKGVLYCERAGLYSRSARWEDIESCDLVWCFNVFGKENRRFILVNQVDGQKFQMNLFNAEQTDRVANFLKTIFYNAANPEH